MPVIEIRALPPKDPTQVPAMLTEIAVQTAATFNIPPAKVWVMFDQLRPEWYAEGGTLGHQRTGPTHPPIVTVRALSGRTREMREAFLKVMCELIGKGLGVDAAAVWVHFVEMEKPEVWTGQRFMESR